MLKYQSVKVSRIGVFVLFVLMLFAYNCLAENINIKGAFSDANAFYEKGKYDEAIAEYQKILDSGFDSGNLYYNIGNCYFKKGKLGHAILNYERARRLMPRNSDLKSNYGYALSLVGGGAAKFPKKWIFGIIDNMYDGFSIDGLVLFLSVLYLFAIITAIASMFVEGLRKYATILLITFAIFFILGMFVFKERIAGMDTDSIIVNKIVDTKFEPFENATTFFQLKEGDKVRIIDSKNGWFKVRRPDGKVGWVQDTSLEVI